MSAPNNHKQPKPKSSSDKRRQQQRMVQAQARRKNGSMRESQGPVTWDEYREISPGTIAFPPSYMRSILGNLSRSEDRCYTIRLGADAAVTTDGSGILNTVYSNIASGAQNWSSYASVFDEHRVLAMTVTFEPLWATGGSSATYWAPIASVIDRSDATALTGYGLAERYQSHKKTAGQKSWKQTVCMSDANEGNFLSTSSPAATSWVKIYSTGNSASTTLGRANVVYLVQFRGLGIN